MAADPLVMWASRGNTGTAVQQSAPIWCRARSLCALWGGHSGEGIVDAQLKEPEKALSSSGTRT